MKDHLFFVKASLGAASRADSLKIRALHVAMAANGIAEVETELVGLKLQLAAAQAELVRRSEAST